MIRTWLEKRGWKVLGPSDVPLENLAWTKGALVTCRTLDAVFLEAEALEDESKELRTTHNAQVVKYIDLAEQHEKLTAERDRLRDTLQRALEIEGRYEVWPTGLAELIRNVPVPTATEILPQEHPNTHADDYLVYSIEDAMEGLNGSILWWKPQACGYTYELNLAGKHTKEKWGHHNVSERHQKMVRVDDAAKVARHIVVVLESDLPRQSNLDCRTEAHHEG